MLLRGILTEVGRCTLCGLCKWGKWADHARVWTFPWLGKPWAAPQAPATVTSSLCGLLPRDLETQQTFGYCFCRTCYRNSRRDLRYCPVVLSFNWFIFSDVNIFCLSKINWDWNLCLLVKGPWSLFAGVVWHSRWTGDRHGLPWQNAGPCPLARIWWHPQHVMELPHLPGGGQQWEWHRLRWLLSSSRYPAPLPPSLSLMWAFPATPFLKITGWWLPRGLGFPRRKVRYVSCCPYGFVELSCLVRIKSIADEKFCTINII